MKEENQNVIESCRNDIKAHFALHSGPAFKYHNWKHTSKVFNYVSEICDNTSGVSENSKTNLQLAALFHDTNYFEGHDKHEERGAAFAEIKLLELDYPKEGINQVQKLIMATRLDYVPQSIEEKIICDADMAHLSEADYISTSFVNLYKEAKSFFNMSLTQWTDDTIALFNSHEYQTDYALSSFAKRKKENLEKLEVIANSKIEDINLLTQPKEKAKGKKKKKNSNATPDRGIETVFRVSLRNHVNLSAIADNKANTLISVNAIIISIVLSTLFPKFDKNLFLVVPAISLLSFSILTIIMAIFSTIPRTTHGLLTREDVRKKRGNLLFFGNFHSMEIDDYEWGMEELMKDRNYLYKSLSRDLFYLGKVLKQKYAFLRIAYFTFVAGLCVSIILFITSIPKDMI
jgi:hypothetical protein